MTEILRNEHLVVAGNDSDGISKVWITPKLSASTIVVPLESNYSISSAYSEQSTRSRELTVESSYISNTTSQHHIFVPLENGVLNVTFMYNGSAAHDNQTITLVQPHKLYHFGNPCPPMCASLGIYRVRTSLYTLCASSSGVCTCQLRQSDTQQQHPTVLFDCYLLSHPNTNITVHRISDVLIFYLYRLRPQLIFALNKQIYQYDLLYHTDVQSILFLGNLNCQVVLRLQIVESKLLIYCVNNTLTEYDFNTEEPFQFNNRLYFPCSDTANFSVNLTNTENADIIYYRTGDTPHRLSQLGVNRWLFKFGECIMYEDHHLFLYTNQSNSLHLINSSMFMQLSLSTNNLYDRPLIVDERYVVTHDLGRQTTSVFDLQDISSPIITQQDTSFQLATVISNLSAIVEFEPTPRSTTTSPVNEEELIIGPPIGIAIAALTVLCLIVIGAIGLTWLCR